MLRLIKYQKETTFEEPREPKDREPKTKCDKYCEEVKSLLEDKKTYKKNKKKMFYLIMG